LKHQSQHKLKAESLERSAAKCGDEALRKARPAQEAALQYAALPYRLGNGLEVLLITSRETGRWVLPKGWPMKGKKAHEAAAREALEEAGVRGKVGKSAVGYYSYGKRLSDGGVRACLVEVFPLEVGRQMSRWPEQDQRTLGWFSPDDAANLVEEPELASLIATFAETFAKSLAA
jgi:8-oxo-dGTP pyrophosphatase MutT (NUDIX family)